MSATNIISKIFLLLSIGLGVYLVTSIKFTIDEREMVSSREEAVIKKLKFIREAQLVYQEVNGNYTSDWDKLIDFIENGKYPIIEKKETIKMLDYGADSSIITYDTLQIISAKYKIFKEVHNINAANDGTFVRYEAEAGDRVVRNTPAYVLHQGGKNTVHKFRNAGKLINRTGFVKGQPVAKGDLLMSLEETKFDPETDVNRIAYVPGYDNIKFDIYANEIERNNLMVDVIEVKNPKPFNINRKESNEAKNRKPLRFGSKTDVTTSGNWE